MEEIFDIKGNAIRDPNGYVFVKIPSHPYAKKNGYVYEHHIVIYKALGKKLLNKFHVHHANENKHDNRNKNLIICQDLAYHKLLHRRLSAFKATGNPTDRKCKFCKQWDNINNLKTAGRYIYHQECNRRVKREQQRKLRRKKIN